MQIIPNFIEDKIIQEDIKNTLTGERSIPYYYNDYIVDGNDKSDFHFVHFLYENNTLTQSVVRCLIKFYHH